MNLSIDPFDHYTNWLDWNKEDAGTDVTISFFGKDLDTIRIEGKVDSEDVFEYFLSRIFKRAMKETAEHYGGSIL